MHLLLSVRKGYSCVCPGETLTAPSGTNIHVCIKILLLYAKVNDLSKPAHDNLLQRYVSNRQLLWNKC